MMLDSSLGIVCILLVFLLNLLNYDSIRSMLWSIVWCDKGGKYNALRNLSDGKSIVEKLKMSFLTEYTKEHRASFQFWMRVKLCFEVAEPILFAIYLICGCIDFGTFGLAIQVLIIVQSILLFVVLLFQNLNKTTKYDRIRMERKQRKKRQ